MALPLTESERALLDAYRLLPTGLRREQRRRGYTLAYRRHLTERYCTRPLPRLWRISEAEALAARQEVDRAV